MPNLESITRRGNTMANVLQTVMDSHAMTTVSYVPLKVSVLSAIIQGLAEVDVAGELILLLTKVSASQTWVALVAVDFRWAVIISVKLVIKPSV